MLQTGISLVIKFKGSLNAECAVRPHGSNVAAMPDDATAIAILFSFRTLASIRFITKVSLFHLEHLENKYPHFCIELVH